MFPKSNATCQQKLVEIREEYISAITHFNWNKLAYEADINFEPVVGQEYFLYHARGRCRPTSSLHDFSRLNVQWFQVGQKDTSPPVLVFANKLAAERNL